MTFDHTANDSYELSSQNPELEYLSVLLVHQDDRKRSPNANSCHVSRGCTDFTAISKVTCGKIAITSNYQGHENTVCLGKRRGLLLFVDTEAYLVTFLSGVSMNSVPE